MEKLLKKISILKYELFWLFGSFCSIVSYDLARTFAGNESRFSNLNALQSPLNVMQIFLYADILILIIMILIAPMVKRVYNINLFSIKAYKDNSKLILGLVFIVSVSMSKSFLATGYTSDILVGYDCISVILSLLFIKLVNKAKVSKQFLGMFSVAMVGFLIFNYEKIGISFELILLFYTIANSMSTAIKNKMGEYRDHINGIIFDNLAYALCGVTLLLILHIKGQIIFNFWITFTIPVLLVAIPSILNHIFDILSNQKIENPIHIAYLDLVKLLIKLISCYVFFNKIPTTMGFIGVFIIIFANNIFNLIKKVKKFLTKLFRYV